MRDTAEPRPAAAEPRPAWGLLAALTALNVLAFVDRQLVAVLAPLLMEDLGLTREEIGILIGVTFIVVFAGLNLVLGAVADRVSRPRLIAAGLAVWSLATGLTGAARSFAHLAVMRAFVGVGEATLTPAGLSMLGDRFPARRLGLASSIFYTGIPLGFAASSFLAGWIAPWLGWRACFLGLGGVGVVAVLAIAFVPDPGRRDVQGAAAASSVPEQARDLGRAIVQRPAILLVSLAAALLGFMGSASQLTMTWLVQERGLEFSRAAFLSGAMLAVGGLLGNVAAGALTDWARQRHPAGRLVGIAVLAALASPMAAAFYLLPTDSLLFYGAWFLAQAWILGWFGPVFAALDELAPPGRRATVLGFGLLVTNLFGVATGPWVAGIVGDRESLTAGLLVAVGVGFLAVVPLLWAARIDTGRRPARPGRE
ncbi:MAG: MFS transporter [Acidobacteria bacterium]|nr:MFS transporter [Acidobacteriota bacterium]